MDVGSGSGLPSLAVRCLGARVHSFSYDTPSVACTAELKRRYFRDDSEWCVEKGSILGKEYVDRLSEFDVVYSWGVLHLTGDFWGGLGCNQFVFTHNNSEDIHTDQETYLSP